MGKTFPHRPRPVNRDSHRLYPLDESFFETIDTEEKAYWLGFIAADGCVYISPSGQQVLSVGLASVDRGHLDKLKQALDITCPLYVHKHLCEDGNWHEDVRLRVCSRRLVGGLLSQGICPRKSLVLKPWRGSQELMRHYWRGMFDGDGAIFKTGKHNAWTVKLVGTHSVVSAFSAFARLATGRAKRPRSHGSVFRVQYCGLTLPQQIIGALYADAVVSLDRKAALATELLAVERRLRDWSKVTSTELLKLKAVHGTWAGVAASLGTTRHSLEAGRKRHGLVPPLRDWSLLTDRELLRLKAVHGSWHEVARALDLPPTTLWNVKHRRNLS